METKTTEEALRWASFCLREAGVAQPRYEAELLFSFCSGKDRLQLRLLQDKIPDANTVTFYERAVNRRCGGEPLSYITGEKFFFGRPFYVNSKVLIPRPETELIVEIALSRFKCCGSQKFSQLNCLDLGAGSGVLAITLAFEFPKANIWAIDLSEDALKIAQYNAKRLNVKERIHFLQGNYFEALRETNAPLFDLVVSNPPYISDHDMNELPADVRNYEPKEALYGGKNGLDGYLSILAGIKSHIKKPGVMLLEIGSNQQEAVEAICRKIKLFKSITCHHDLAGLPRVIEGLV